MIIILKGNFNNSKQVLSEKILNEQNISLEEGGVLLIKTSPFITLRHALAHVKDTNMDIAIIFFHNWKKVLVMSLVQSTIV
jgi:hypothetical protein